MPQACASTDEAIFSITTDDVRSACDLFHPIYDAQANGDAAVLAEHGRPVVALTLTDPQAEVARTLRGRASGTLVAYKAALKSPTVADLALVWLAIEGVNAALRGATPAPRPTRRYIDVKSWPQSAGDHARPPALSSAAA